MARLHMRDATRDDLPAIVAMLADDIKGAAREDASLPLDPGYFAAFAAISADPKMRLVVAEFEGLVVGTVQIAVLPGLSRKGASRGHLEAVRIASDMRGQGLGAELVHWAVEQCRAAGCGMVQLTTQRDRIDAHRFYERLGWERSHIGYKLHLRGIA
ncbi:GNAT family N-acetyltransferase [Sphingomonas sp. H39-1-10]|uniref:GNAT family N-acetyltransferase n=1 Tax=Sphingomonas pollutisoli TaxID=3030829 RepID=UPI0023B9A490|nr:GNAT family N-acetyltransferase [Sphingomonas pollutisoli]MDF0488987.1 GNAT family N-acetyltransferase [Sphingomonas pollutisoli]